MAIDQTGFREVGRERILPPGELVTSEGILEQLKVPEDVLKDPRLVASFFANRHVQLQSSVIKADDVKSQPADIPEFIFNERDPKLHVMSLSSEEQTALKDWSHGHAVAIQSGSASFNSLEGEVSSYLNDMKLSHPDLGSSSSGASFSPSDPISSVLDQLVSNAPTQQTQEENKKFWEAMMAAKDDPETLSTMIGVKYARQAMQKVGQLVEMYKYHVDLMDKHTAAIDLQMSKPGGQDSASVMKANMQFTQDNLDISQLSQLMSKAMNDYQTMTASAAKTNDQVEKHSQGIIKNTG